MRRAPLLLVLVSTLSWAVQDTEPKPTLSNDPLTAEQIQIYRAFLQEYTKGSDKTLHVADVTDPINASPIDLKEMEGCLKGISLDNLQKANSVVHRMDPAIADNAKIVFVESDQQAAVVRENDPHKALHPGEKLDDKQLDKVLDTAFANGLFSFSEIVFDKKHTWAVLTFSFSCGSLCGHGGVLVFHKGPKGWKLTKRDCGSWMS